MTAFTISAEGDGADAVPTNTEDKRPTDTHKRSKAITTAVPVNLVRLTNARILRPDGTFMSGSLTMDRDRGSIVAIESSVEENRGIAGIDCGDAKDIADHSTIFDCGGKIVSPGFIDIQLNGAFGIDFSYGDDGDGRTDGRDANCAAHGKTEHLPLTVDGVSLVAQRLVETGVTSFCPTMVSSSRETYRRNLRILKEAKTKSRMQIPRAHPSIIGGAGATVLGAHLEGPHFARSKRGAHADEHIHAPSKGIASLQEAYGFGDGEASFEDVEIITLAPELEGANEAIKSLTSPKNSRDSVVVSCGHTEATYEDGIRALSSGSTLVTHLFNAMNPFHHRTPGLVGLLSSEKRLAEMNLTRPFYSMIVDGIHIHESAVSMAYQSHPHGCVLVTDAMSAMGLGDGEHSLGSMSVCIKGDRAVLSGTDILAGSVVSMDTCVQRFRKFTGCSTGEALLCATLHPAMVLKRHILQPNWKDTEGTADVADLPLGVLEVGAKADVTLLNDGLEVLAVWTGGCLAFERNT